MKNLIKKLKENNLFSKKNILLGVFLSYTLFGVSYILINGNNLNATLNLPIPNFDFQDFTIKQIIFPWNSWVNFIFITIILFILSILIYMLDRYNYRKQKEYLDYSFLTDRFISWRVVVEFLIFILSVGSVVWIFIQTIKFFILTEGLFFGILFEVIISGIILILLLSLLHSLFHTLGKWIIYLITIGILLLFLSSCEREYNIEIESESNDSIIVVYQHDNIRVESTESDSTANCPDGEIHFFVFRNDTLISNISYCKDSLPSGEICPDSWDYISFEGCDTIYDYDCHGFLKFKIPICPEIIILPGDTIVIHDTTTIVDTVFIDGENWVREFFFENCNNPGNSVYYSSLGWNLGEGFLINQLGSTIGNGTIVCNLNTDTIWTPQLFSEPMSVDSIFWPVGSKESFVAEILLKDIFNQIIVVESANAFANPFDWQDISTYKFVSYSVPLSELGLNYIVKAGIAITKIGTKSVQCTPTRDEKFNSDNIFIRGVKKLN